MVEIIIVIAIVAVVAVLAGRSFYRTMTGRNERCRGCGCADAVFTNIKRKKQEK